MKILLVASSPDSPTQLIALLESFAYELLHASSEQHALDLFCQHAPDLVLVRVTNPEVDGLALTRAIRETEVHKRLEWTPVVFLTASEHQEGLVPAISAGVDDLISQSVHGDILHAKIAAWSRMAVVRRNLETSKVMFEHILRSVSEGIHVLDLDGVIIAENKSALLMLGWNEDDKLIGRHGHQTIHYQHADHSDFPVTECPIYQTLRDGEVRHIKEDVFWRKDGSSFPVEYKAAPLLDNNGAIYGVTVVFQDITERKAKDEQILRMAQFCELTDLPNRSLFKDRFNVVYAGARRNQTRFALIFIDLDKFKPVNDHYGHAAGDFLLQQVAQRMRDCIRESDTVARIGGDEFVVLLPQISIVADALAVAEKLCKSLAEPVMYGMLKLDVSASLGIAIYPDHGDAEQELRRHADEAMYLVKQSGGNAYRMYGG